MEFLIDGKKVANEIKSSLKEKTDELIKKQGKRPGLALLRVGDDPASKIYVNMKIKACEKLNYKSVNKILPEDASEEEVLKIVNEWNADNSIHGILVQLPLPDHVDTNKVIKTIDPKKDVDGFHPISMGSLVIGMPGLVPCTPAGIVRLLNYYNIETEGKHTVVAGRSNIVGKPVANLLYQKYNSLNSIVTIVHSRAKDISLYTKNADILITAIGDPEFIKKEHIKKGAVLIDVGITRVEDKTKEKGYRVTGDVDFEDVREKARAITPVPGGVGPLTIAMLMENTYKACIGDIER